MKFLHTADLHLDSAFCGDGVFGAEARRERQRELLKKIFRIAEDEACDMILIAGDMFDTSFVTPETRKLCLSLFEEFKKHFPLFLILCAVVHTGEYGNEIHDQLGGWHMHIDYLPVYDLGPDGPGLRMGTGLDEALRRMGYEEEDSIVITRHRPLLYTTMHNMMFRIMERILPDYGFRLKLGVTAETYPDKDPGRNLPLPAWQAHMQETVDVQAVKNQWLDVLMADEVSPDSVKQALGSLAMVQDAMRTVQGASKTWDGSAYKLPETDYIRLQGAVESMMDTMAYVIAKGEQADTYSARVDDLSKQLDALQIENARLEREISALRQKELDRRINMAEAERQCRDLQRIINRQIAFMKSIQNGAHTIYNLYNEMYDDRNKSRE